MKPDYCTQNAGVCPTCALVSYGRDCANHRLAHLGDLAQRITGGNVPAMAKLLNDAGIDPRLDELAPDPGAFIPRPALAYLVAMRAGDRVGRLAAQVLSE